MLSVLALVLIAAIVFISGFIQSFTGFGFALATLLGDRTLDSGSLIE